MKDRYKKLHLIRGILLGMMLVLLLGCAVQAEWKTNKKGTYWVEDGKRAKLWKKIQKKWYYFGEDGYLKKGKTQDTTGAWYYLDKKTGVRINKTWIKIGKKYYYAAANGKLQRNKWIGNSYVNEKYQRVTGWKAIDGRTYYFNESTGIKATGWTVIGKYSYFFNKKTGVMVTNKWIKKKIGTTKKYCWLKSNGQMAVSTWVGKYRVGKDGARTGKTRSTGVVKENGKYYFYNASYVKQTGWQTYNNQKYYFDAKTKAALIGRQTIAGYTYYFEEDGTMATGWVEIGNKTYYCGSDGHMVMGTTVTISGSKYTFDSTGVCSNINKGKKIVEYAKKFLGYPYVYGGNNLKTGVDCSGFTQQVMKRFKIYIPRTADQQMRGKDNWGSYTKSVSIKPNKANLQPGDLVFYGTKKYSGHVAIYIGNGKIIHASTPETGIIISAFNYNKPVAARRYW